MKRVKVTAIPTSNLFEIQEKVTCCATLSQHTLVAKREWLKRKLIEDDGRIHLCHDAACVMIDKKPYCRKHGGMLALQLAVQRGDV